MNTKIWDGVVNREGLPYVESLESYMILLLLLMYESHT